MAMQLMRGGSLRSALLEPEKQQQLRWSARCDPGCTFGKEKG